MEYVQKKYQTKINTVYSRSLNELIINNIYIYIYIYIIFVIHLGQQHKHTPSAFLVQLTNIYINNFYLMILMTRKKFLIFFYNFFSLGLQWK